MRHKIMMIDVREFGESLNSFDVYSLKGDLGRDVNLSTIVILTDGKTSQVRKNRELGFVEVKLLKTQSGVCCFDIHSENQLNR